MNNINSRILSLINNNWLSRTSSDFLVNSTSPSVTLLVFRYPNTKVLCDILFKFFFWLKPIKMLVDHSYAGLSLTDHSFAGRSIHRRLQPVQLWWEAASCQTIIIHQQHIRHQYLRQIYLIFPHFECGRGYKSFYPKKNYRFPNNSKSWSNLPNFHKGGPLRTS